MLYVIVPLLIVGFSVFTLKRDIVAENWGNAAFAGFNAFVASWAILAYIGIKNTLADIWIGLTNWMYVEVKNDNIANKNDDDPSMDWRSVLYHGDTEGTIPLIERSAALEANMNYDEVRAA
jgi:cellulose synthase (UDP-forming)